ncbi:hypothetical protein AJ80_02682 [Polytolypa hystricis UAMH7299]|uniref:Uncharacterized protein n=1 Tax=Polytolypa hystricis (strain UAMH7299) TaxID=1447883 RepID=A0A2B7YNN5_POLH7|nr:hypothetical protein AJ80_02682 [Polytolypa hystricis UAMH7299]
MDGISGRADQDHVCHDEEPWPSYGSGHSRHPSWMEVITSAQASLNSTTSPVDDNRLPPLVSMIGDRDGGFFGRSNLMHRPLETTLPPITGTVSAPESSKTSPKGHLAPKVATGGDISARRPNDPEPCSPTRPRHVPVETYCTACSRCARVESLIQGTLLRALELDTEIRAASRGSSQRESPAESARILSEITSQRQSAGAQVPNEAERSLQLTMSVVVSGTRLISELRRAYPSMPDILAMTAGYLEGLSSTDQTMSSFASLSDQPGRLDGNEIEQGGHHSPIGTPLSPFHALDSTHGKFFAASQDGKCREGVPGALHSACQEITPNQPLASSAAHARQGREIGIPTAPTVTEDTSHTTPVHSAPLWDIQSQLRAKTLALQARERAYDRLLADCSRQHGKFCLLERMMNVSNHKIEELSQDRIQLQCQIEMLEAQVEKLAKQKEESHRQSVTSGSQYMQIMAMSTQLQAQGAVDRRRWKSEKEEWNKEKNMLKDKLRDLQRQVELWSGLPE